LIDLGRQKTDPFHNSGAADLSQAMIRNQATLSPQVLSQSLFIHFHQIKAHRPLADFVPGGGEPFGYLEASQGSAGLLQHSQNRKPLLFGLFSHEGNFTTKNAALQHLIWYFCRTWHKNIVEALIHILQNITAMPA
jgi:hypothetical protein